MNKRMARFNPPRELNLGSSVAQRRPMLFNELAMRYLASHSATLSASVFNLRVHHLSEQLLGFFGLQALKDIRPARLHKFIYSLEDKGLQAHKIQACLVTFRVCMKYAFDQKWLLDPTLTKPLGDAMNMAMTDPSCMSEGEFHLLYQDLVQDVTEKTFH